MVGHLFQNCRFKAYKSRLYRLDGQQNRFDLYHVRLDHPRWSVAEAQGLGKAVHLAMIQLLNKPTLSII